MLEKEKVEVTDVGEVKFTKEETEKIPEGLMEKVEKGDLYLTKPVTDDHTSQILVTAPSAQKPKIVLPLTRQQLTQGLSYKVNEAIRWLAEWYLRIIKMKPKQVVFKDS